MACIKGAPHEPSRHQDRLPAQARPAAELRLVRLVEGRGIRWPCRLRLDPRRSDRRSCGELPAQWEGCLMPRPKSGYFNAAGQPIPGTHDPISRFMDQTALKIWAHKQGLAGLPIYKRSAIDIGSAVHGMAELDLKGRPDREIEAYA